MYNIGYTVYSYIIYRRIVYKPARATGPGRIINGTTTKVCDKRGLYRHLFLTASHSLCPPSLFLHFLYQTHSLYIKYNMHVSKVNTIIYTAQQRRSNELLNLCIYIMEIPIPTICIVYI